VEHPPRKSKKKKILDQLSILRTEKKSQEYQVRIPGEAS
jgi:hypothetical protein